MGLVEVSTSVNNILTQLEKEKRGLQKIDEHIKKSQVSGRFQNERNTERSFQSGPINDGPRSGGRNVTRNLYTENNRGFDDDNRQNRKRPQETKTVFSRLSGRLPVDSDGEDETPFPKKPRISSQVIRELPTKQEVLKAQAGDEVSKARNRRMFGSLLGTLQKFKQEEIILKNKEEKKAKIEKKIEDQAKQEKENQKRERQNLLAEREMKKASIKALEAKMIRLESYEIWEKTQKPLLNYIQTKWKPHICWLPKKMNDQAKEKYDVSRKKQEKILEDKQKELKEELEGIEQKYLRSMKLPPGLKKRPTSLSETLATDGDMNQSPEHEEEDDGNGGSPQHNDEDEDDAENETSVVSNIKQEKVSDKEFKAVNVKVEKENKVDSKPVERKSSDSESDDSEDEDSSSEEEGRHYSSDEGVRHRRTIKKEKTENTTDDKKNDEKTSEETSDKMNVESEKN